MSTKSSDLGPRLIVWGDRPDLVGRFGDRLRGIMPVVLDRRTETRRRQTSRIGVERRRGERRQLLMTRTQARFQVSGYRLVYSPEPEPELSGIAAPGFCGACERILDMDMPHFVETPMRVELDVLHSSRARLHHPVDLEAFLPSGRLLLACQIGSREAW